MHFRTIILLLGLTGTFHLQAQENKTQPAHLGFIYPISSNGRNAASYSNHLSIHALGGISRCETGVAVAGLTLVIKDSARGVQIAGISNHITNSAAGLQVAGIINTTGNSKGTAIAGISNMAHDITGPQIAGITNIANNVGNMQIAGVTNTAKRVKGLQIAGIVNTATEVEGTQIAGIINVARKVKGVQIAGLINIADSSDYSIAIINIIKNGKRHIGVSADESGVILASLRSGGRVLYGIAGVGLNVRTHKVLFAAEYGIGAWLWDTKTISFQTELVRTGMFNFDGGQYWKSSLRILPRLRLGKQCYVWAGPSFNYINTDMEETSSLIKNTLWEKKKSKGTEQLAFGAMAGFQIKI